MNKKLMVLLLTAVSVGSIMPWRDGGGFFGIGVGPVGIGVGAGPAYGGYYDGYYGPYDHGYYGSPYYAAPVVIADEPKPAEYYEQKGEQNRRDSISQQIKSLDKEITRLEKEISRIERDNRFAPEEKDRMTRRHKDTIQQNRKKQDELRSKISA